jgi:hypothetical protein
MHRLVQELPVMALAPPLQASLPPMPSFADNIKPDEAWNLVFCLRTLMSQPSREKEMAKQLGLKLVNPNAPAGQQ